MLYQLPNGRVIYLSVEQYLSLTEQDIRDLNSANFGEYPTLSLHVCPDFHKIKRTVKKDFQDEGIDYTPDSDEVDNGSIIDINSIPEEDHPFEG